MTRVHSALGFGCAICLSLSAAGQIVTTRDITPYPPLSPHEKITRVAVHPTDGGRLLAAFSREVRFSRDGGTAWSAPSIPPVLDADVDRLYVHKGRPGVVFLHEAAQDWTPILGPRVRSGGRTFRSADFGETWTLVRGAYAETGEYSIAAFGSDPDEPERLFGTQRHPIGCRGSCPSADRTIVESHDGGGTWSPANAGLPAFGGSLDGADGPVPGAPSRLYFAGSGAAFVSSDSARTWTLLPSTSDQLIEWVKQDPARPDILYALGNLPPGYQFDTAGHSRILRSDDAGRSWRVIFMIETAQRHYRVVPALTIDPAHPDRIWLTGVEYGVLLSQDGGTSWANLGFTADPYLYFPGADPATIATNLVTSTTDPSRAYFIFRGRLIELAYAPLRRDPVAIEYQAGDRYWVSAQQGEAVSQDYRGNEALRSGLRFGVWNAASAPPGAQGICRFQGHPAHGQHSRFLALQGAECEIVKANPAFVLEGENEYFAMPPDESGGCSAGLVPVHRFNNLEPSVNHRYVADPAIAQQMRGHGWYDEGVRMCARRLEPQESQ